MCIAWLHLSNIAPSLSPVGLSHENKDSNAVLDLSSTSLIIQSHT